MCALRVALLLCLASWHASALSADELPGAVLSECLAASAAPGLCLRQKVLRFLDSAAGSPSGRALADDEQDQSKLDEAILQRVQRYVTDHRFFVQLPGVEVSFTPATGRADVEPRDMMKKKLLLPLLLLLKLKMKALTPILLAVVGLKAMKALILSKLAILLVGGFLVMQLCKKMGMPMPMMGAEPAPTPMPPTSYEQGWDTNANGAGGPYQRVWDAHNLAYNAYQQAQQQTPQQYSSTN